VQVGRGGRPPVQVGIDDPPANRDGGMIAKIVCGFEHDPGRIQRLVRLRLVGDDTETIACNSAECDGVHGRYSPGFRSVVSLHNKRRLALRAGIGAVGILARLIEFQNALGGLDLEAAKLALQIIQLFGGDAVILGAKKEQ